MIKLLKRLTAKKRAPRADVKGRVILATAYSSKTNSRLSSGNARNLSASGISFESSEVLRIGSVIRFAIELETGEGTVMMRCSGRIVRREVLENKRVAFAVQFDEQKIER